jgi:hypothetical protein
MAQVEEIKRVRRNLTDEEAKKATVEETPDRYEEEYYDVGDSIPEEQGLNTASGVLALLLLALAVYLIWAALR